VRLYKSRAESEKISDQSALALVFYAYIRVNSLMEDRPDDSRQSNGE